jgi:hypothetical protein
MVVLFTTSEWLADIGFWEMIISTVVGMGTTWAFLSVAWRTEPACESIDDRLSEK